MFGIKKEHDIARTVEAVGRKLKFSGSLVLVPGLLDGSDVEDIIALVERCGGDSVRLFMVGYTRLSSREDTFIETFNYARSIVDDLRGRYSVPVMVEPSVVSNLDCVVEGVVAGSPAEKGGIRHGDTILAVDGGAVMTRVDGYSKAFRKPSPVLQVLRDGDTMDIKLKKPANSSPGFVLLYDIGPDVAGDIRNAVKRHNGEKVLFLTSELGQGVLAALLGKSDTDFSYDIKAVKNRFFGGSIKCAGLLTLEDVGKAAEEYISGGARPDLILLPPVMLDFKKRDLLGKSLRELEGEIGIPLDTSG